MTVQQQILQLPKAEKLELMELLWVDLSKSDAGFESPKWHEQALRKTSESLDSGNEEIHNWKDAKQNLRGE
jgi:hypothetical protein